MTIASLIIDVAANTGKITRDVEKITGQMDRIATSAANAERGTAGITSKMVALGTAAGTFLGNLAYDAVKKMGAALIEVASRGIELAPVSSAFQALARSVGESGDAMLQVARTATKGLIGDLDLMQAANKGILLGLPITSASFGTLAQTAVVLGKAMGQGPVQSFDDLITALGRSSPMILDNLGLSVKVGEANDKYARSVGKTADSLTDAEKKLAFYNAAMDAAKRKVDEVGGLQLTFADRVQQARVAFTNFTDALGVAIATSPVINAAFGAFSDAIGSAFGENQTVLVQRLMGVVNRFAIGTVDAAQVGISAAGIIGRAWSGLQLIFAGTASVIASLGLAFANLVAGAANLATKIPGLGDGFRGVAASANDLATFMGGVQQSFHDQAQAALSGVQGNSTFQQTLDRVSGTLGTMRASMAAAASQQVDAAVIASQLARAHDAQVTSTAKASAEADKLARAWASYTSTGATVAETLGRMNGTVVEAIKWDLAHGKSKSDLATIYGVTGDQVEAVGEQLRLETLMAEAAAGAHQKLATSVWNVSTAAEALRARPLVGSAFIPTLQSGPNPQITAAATSFSQNFGAVLQTQLPQSIMAAIQGGGNVLQAAGSTLGSFLTSDKGFGKMITGGLTKLLGDGMGAAVSTIIPGLGALVGPALQLAFKGLKKLFGGPSEDELAGRNVVADFEKSLQSTLTAQQQAEAGGRSWAATVISVRDAYAKIGLPASQAEADVERLWASSREGAAASAAAVSVIEANLRRVTEAEEATAAAAQASAAVQAERAATMQKQLQGLMDQRQSLFNAIQNEAPEEVMGVVETATRAQMAVLDEQIAAQQRQLELEAQTAANTLESTLSAIDPEPVHVPVVFDIPDLPGGLRMTDSPDVVPMAAGGYGTVTKPTLFLAGEAGPEQVAFSGANKRFAGASQVVDMSAVRSELQALRQQQADQQAYFSGQFARDLSRAVRDEVQKVSVIRR